MLLLGSRLHSSDTGAVLCSDLLWRVLGSSLPRRETFSAAAVGLSRDHSRLAFHTEYCLQGPFPRVPFLTREWVAGRGVSLSPREAFPQGLQLDVSCLFASVPRFYCLIPLSLLTPSPVSTMLHHPHQAPPGQQVTTCHPLWLALVLPWSSQHLPGPPSFSFWATILIRALLIARDRKSVECTESKSE